MRDWACPIHSSAKKYVGNDNSANQFANCQRGEAAEGPVFRYKNGEKSGERSGHQGYTPPLEFHFDFLRACSTLSELMRKYLLRGRASSLSPSLLQCALALIIAVSAYANDWPQFRGPNRDDASQETSCFRIGPQAARLWPGKPMALGKAIPRFQSQVGTSSQLAIVATPVSWSLLMSRTASRPGQPNSASRERLVGVHRRAARRANGQWKACGCTRTMGRTGLPR